MTTYDYEKIIVALFACFVITTFSVLFYLMKPTVAKTLTCNGKTIVTSNRIFISNNTWVWSNGTYTPSGGEICVLIEGEDK